ncbi:ATP-binding protein [Actinoplanes sp. M2I2]|uniref:ATP-binding protein n=1 Tax=Actinoplanes sp. M2I2 TaxID=1734444 RepID=UPI002020CA20|nr:ATP-binding protein [Actinoplanes sp. M2I2]
MTDTGALGTITPAELKTLFLFEKLTGEQLTWIAELGYTQHVEAGQFAIHEGELADKFFVLLSGTIALTRRVGPDDVQTTRTEQRGVYMGATQAYIRDEGVEHKYMLSMRALDDADFFVMSAADFSRLMREWYPMAQHLIEGLLLGVLGPQDAISQRQGLVALGALSAGLMHEINNPAAAAARATGALRLRLAGMRHKLGLLAAGKVAPELLDALVELQEDVIERAAKAPALTAMQASDREDELGDWMEEHNVTGGWDLAPVYAQGGLDVDCLEEIKIKLVESGLLGQAIHWIGYALETEQLMSDIEDATGRVSSLVTSAKQYSQLDRAAHQWIDMHTGLDSTLVLLGHKIGNGIRVVKDFARDLPQIPAHPAELNQVWANIIDNALQAMNGAGTLTIRTYRSDDHVIVSIGDTGPGVPEALRKRVFEPFFTTKAVGEGTGLGLDISYRIVVNGHGGDIVLESQPGDTRFLVSLPITEPSSR